MDYTQDMFLLSDSGYAMPFRAENDKPIEILLPYGKQKHPRTGQEFWHTGWDIKTDTTILQALASGKVIGITSADDHTMTLVIRYGRYEVTYSHLQGILVNFDAPVVAGTKVAVSNRFFHFGVKLHGDDINPVDFLGMIYSNMLAYEQAESDNTQIPVNMLPVNTAYDKDSEEIESMMINYLPDFLGSVYKGRYSVPDSQMTLLREVFKGAYNDKCFFETMPSLTNPLGLSTKAKIWIESFQNLFIQMFLAFMAQTQSLFLTSADEESKKKLIAQ